MPPSWLTSWRNDLFLDWRREDRILRFILKLALVVGVVGLEVIVLVAVARLLWP